ncbi:MAG TPA: hypothetical protein VI036_00595 [Propionibacteriaceae bacterium]|jgi:hypothetical protein
MSTEPTFAEIASRQLSRRSVLVAAGTLAAAKTFADGCRATYGRDTG